MNFKLFLTFLFYGIMLIPQKAQAVPLPEITNSIGPAILNIISILALIFSSFFYYLNKQARIIKLIIIIIAVTGTYLLGTIMIEKLNLKELEKQQRKNAEVIAANKIDPQISLMKMDNFTSFFERDLSNVKAKALTVEQFKEILINNKSDTYMLFDAHDEKVLYDVEHIRNAQFWNENDSELVMKIKNLDENILVIFYCEFGWTSSDLASKFLKYHEQTYFVNDNPIYHLPEFVERKSDYIKRDCGKMLKMDEAKEFVKKGALLVDSRTDNGNEKYKFNTAIVALLKNTINLPAFDLELVKKISKAGLHEKGIVVICFDNRSCREACYLSRVMNESLDGKFGKSFGILPIATIWSIKEDPKKE